MEYDYIDRPEQLEAALPHMRGSSMLAVDTEAAGYHRYLDRISLIQVSTRERNFLIDPLAGLDLSALSPLLADPAVETLFHDADYDLRILDRDLGLHVAGLFDTQIAAAFLGVRSLGLGALLEQFLNVKVPKAYQRADWAERPLSEGMKDYAATDTAYLPALRDVLHAKLVEAKRLHWAEEEFRLREETRWSEPDGERQAFMRIKGARDLDPRGLAVLKEVHGWRETVAEERDQAPFRVLNNQPMVEMGLRPPRTAAELRNVNGVSDGLIRHRGDAILDAVRRGLDVPDSDLPRFPPARRWDRDPEADARAERLRDVRAKIAGTLHLDPGFLISRAVLDEVARRIPLTPEELLEVPAIRRWHLEAIGDELLRSLRH